MNDRIPITYLASHGETAGTISRQDTGLTDLPLTEQGERNARNLAERLRGLTFTKVLASPLQRAIRTCELAGFGGAYEIDRDLLEWSYEEYEGRLTADIHAGCPGCWPPLARGRFFLLSTASLSALSYEHTFEQRAIRLWDDTRHVKIRS